MVESQALTREIMSDRSRAELARQVQETIARSTEAREVAEALRWGILSPRRRGIDEGRTEAEMPSAAAAAAASSKLAELREELARHYRRLNDFSDMAATSEEYMRLSPRIRAAVTAEMTSSSSSLSASNPRGTGANNQ
ncbi:hypothetical protein PMAYCL1PPCAC_00635, partial [Pristionchus mayeri]